MQQVVLAVARDGAQVIELLTVAMGNNVALVDQQRWVGLYLLLDAVAQALTEVELLTQSAQTGIFGVETGRLDGLDGHKGMLQLHHLTRRHPSHGHLRYDALEVAHAMELLVDQMAEVRLLEEIVHHILPVGYLPHILQRKHHPSAQQSASHGGHGAVNDTQERRSVVLHGLQQLQRADGELVEAHVFFLLQTLQRGDVVDMGVLRNFEVLHDGACGNDAILQVIHTKALEVLGAEMLEQFLPSRLVGEHPVVEFEHAIARTEIALKIGLAVAVVEHLLG